MSSVTTPAGRRERRSADSEVSGGTGHRAAPRATYVLVLALLSLFAWAPLFYPGYVEVHSGFLPVFNLTDLAASQNKLSWLPTIGASGDVLRGEGPLVYWLALLPRPVTGDIGAVKGLFAFSILAGGLGVAAWTRRVLAGWAEERDIIERSALLAAAVFMLWPLLLMTVYVRGALAEALFIGLVPWAFWGVTGNAKSRSGAERRLVVKPSGAGHITAGENGRARLGSGNPAPEASRRDGGIGPNDIRYSWLSIAGTVLAVTLLFLTQAGLAMWAAVVLVGWAVWPGAPTRSRLVAVGAVLAGAAIGLGLLWLLHSGAAGSLRPIDMAAHAVYPYQLFSPAWGFGISTLDWKGDLPLQLGLAALALSMLTVVLGLASSRAGEKQVSASTPVKPWQSALGFSLIVGLILILLTTTLARPLWRAFPALAITLTYPWQLFALVGPLLALVAGAVLVVDRRLALLPMTAGLLAFVVLSSAPALSPRFTQVDPGPAAAGIFGNNQVTLLTAHASFGSNLASSTGAPPTLHPPPSTLQATTPLTVTLAWQALQPINLDYNLFVHALDGAGNKLAQWDGQPLRGQESYPMTRWQVGEIVPGTIRLELLPEQAAAVRQAVVGLYDWQSGNRLSVGSDDKVIVDVSLGADREVAP